MLTASMTIDPDFQVSEVRRRTFGSFVEHLGRCVYTGIFDPRENKTVVEEDIHRVSCPLRRRGGDGA